MSNTLSIEEGNKIISEFMGNKSDWPLYSMAWFKSLKYHTSWDWLMPVVEKINKECLFTGYPDECLIQHLRIISTPIKEAWESVIEFIQFLNTTKSKP